MRQRPRRRLLFFFWAAGIALLGSPFANHLSARQGGAAAGAASQATLKNAPTNPVLRGFRWREIGPTGQGGRIDDYAVDEKEPYRYFVGFAVSGVWRTLNNGTTFDPIFDTTG
jgi:hypothetical protein